MASDHLKRVLGGLDGWQEIAGRWHIFVSLCVVQGVSKSQIQEWVGHLSGEMTDHCTHLSKKQAEQAMSQAQLEVGA